MFTPRIEFPRRTALITQVKCDRNCSFPDKELPNENIYFRLCGDRNQERGLWQHFSGGWRWGRVGLGVQMCLQLSRG